MSADTLLPIVAIVMILVLVGRRFWSRDIPLRETVKLALIWVAILSGLWILVTVIRT